MRLSNKLLDEIFGRPIDGGSSNPYVIIQALLEDCVRLGLGNKTVSVKQLLVVIKRQSKKWEKSIDRYLYQ